MPTDVLVEEMIEEEQLVLALKASMDTAPEERAALLANFIYDKAPADLPISLFS